MVEAVVQAAVGIGVIISLIFSEFLGASAGGIVVPGYIALYLDRPMQILGTLIISLLTWGIIRLVSQFTLLFGRRRMVLSILVGFILGWASRLLVFHDITTISSRCSPSDTSFRGSSQTGLSAKALKTFLPWG